jgi:hypothetical protein
MNDEIQFVCDICHEKFDAIPDAMVECRADFKAMDPETGAMVELDEVTKKEVFKKFSSDPTIGPFLKGAACICLKCQNKLAESADSIHEEGKEPPSPF